MKELPGVNPVFHEGKISGTFDLASSDMAQVEYGGRLVLVLVADVVNLNIHDVKGDQTAFWTLKGADAAIVRDDGMKDHLAKTLHLSSLDPSLFDEDNVTRGPTLVGTYDDEGAFLGFEEEEEITVAEETEEIQVAATVGAATVVTNNEPDGPPTGERVGPHVRHRDKSLEAFLYGKEEANVR